MKSLLRTCVALLVALGMVGGVVASAGAQGDDSSEPGVIGIMGDDKDPGIIGIMGDDGGQGGPIGIF